MAPGISSVEPDSGVVGTEVTIFGMNFSANIMDNTITFNGTSASITSVSETELIAEVPDGATDGPVEVMVEQKSTTGPDFNVITTGTIEIAVTTTGVDLDSNGYSINIDGGIITTETNDTAYVTNLDEGSYSLELSGVAENCSADDENPRDVSVAAGDTTFTSYMLTCSSVLKNKIVFASNRSGSGNTAFEIYMSNTDGTSPERLTINDNPDFLPSISPDGTRIAYLKIVDGINPFRIHIMNADGSNDVELTRDLEEPEDFSIFWSPDGDKLAFVSGSGKDGNDQVHVINVDGTNQINIRNNDFIEFISPMHGRLMVIEYSSPAQRAAAQIPKYF